MNLENKFKNQHPDVIFLKQEVSPELENYLRERKWLQEDEKLKSVGIPGEGNMNFVIRLVTDQRSLIMKQSRPWVQKFPQVGAPIERVYVEYNFYRFVAPHKNISRFTPAVLGFDPENYTLLLEDLGEGADYTYLYRTDRHLSGDEIQALVELLSTLHQVEVPAKDRQHLDNQAMKKLNHEHIFVFPYAVENGFNLDEIQPGLQSLAMQYKQDESLKSDIIRLGEIYLQNHNTLLHGDYYPGSWLKVEKGLKLIDPEFSYFGKAEFDMGVMLAHLKMSEHHEATIRQVSEAYKQPEDFDDSLLWAFTGVEIMRRIIGLAQLPLSLSLDQKENLLSESAKLIRQYPLKNQT